MISWLRTIFQRRPASVAVNVVFTPSGPAKRLFVARAIEAKRLRNQLRATGKQIVVYGESGAGKSSLTERVLADCQRAYVTTRCTATTTYDDLLHSGFDLAKAYFVAESERTVGESSRAGASIGGRRASMNANAEHSETDSSIHRRIVDVQLNEGNLAAVFKDRSLTWVVEDFHKVGSEARRSFAELLKIFSDTNAPDTAIIVLGARENAEEVVTLPDANVRDRVASIELRPLDNDELAEILTVGGRLLNVDFSRVSRQIVQASAGVASVTHGLAKACLDELDLTETSATPIVVSPETLSRAADEYVQTSAVHVRAQFTRALTSDGTRARRFANYPTIVHALATFPEHGATYPELLATIQQNFYSDYPPGNLSQYLGFLSEERRGEIIRKTSDGRFRFSTPLHLTYAKLRFGLHQDDDLFSRSVSQLLPADEAP